MKNPNSSVTQILLRSTSLLCKWGKTRRHRNVSPFPSALDVRYCGLADPMFLGYFPPSSFVTKNLSHLNVSQFGSGVVRTSDLLFLFGRPHVVLASFSAQCQVVSRRKQRSVPKDECLVFWGGFLFVVGRIKNFNREVWSRIGLKIFADKSISFLCQVIFGLFQWLSGQSDVRFSVRMIENSVYVVFRFACFFGFWHGFLLSS